MVIGVLVLIVLGWSGLCLAAFLFQRRLLYFPARSQAAEELAWASRQQLLPWKTPEGQILGWKAPHPSGRPVGTLLVLHGNAGTALDRTYFREAFQAPGMPVALDLVLLEYPGYGSREGSPTEDTLVAAATEAIDQLHRDSPRPILLAGESLGSAVAALAAAKRPESLEGLLLIVPLKHTAAVARRHYPFLPTFLIRDTLRTDKALEHLAIPAAFVVAGRDEVVFPDLGQELFHAYGGEKRLWIVPGAGHNSLEFSPQEGRWQEVLAFLAQSWPGYGPPPIEIAHPQAGQ